MSVSLVGDPVASRWRCVSPAHAADYFPPKGDAWATHTPQQEKLDPAKLKAAIDFAVSAELQYPPELAKVADIRDLRISVPLKYAGEAFSSPIGPLKAACARQRHHHPPRLYRGRMGPDP